MGRLLFLGRELAAVLLDESQDVLLGSEEALHLLDVEGGRVPSQPVDLDAALGADLDQDGVLAIHLRLELGVLRLECLKLLFDAHVGRAHVRIHLSIVALSVS